MKQAIILVALFLIPTLSNANETLDFESTEINVIGEYSCTSPTSNLRVIAGRVEGSMLGKALKVIPYNPSRPNGYRVYLAQVVRPKTRGSSNIVYNATDVLIQLDLRPDTDTPEKLGFDGYYKVGNKRPEIMLCNSIKRASRP